MRCISYFVTLDSAASVTSGQISELKAAFATSFPLLHNTLRHLTLPSRLNQNKGAWSFGVKILVFCFTGNIYSRSWVIIT